MRFPWPRFLAVVQTFQAGSVPTVHLHKPDEFQTDETDRVLMETCRAKA